MLYFLDGNKTDGKGKQKHKEKGKLTRSVCHCLSMKVLTV
jgi:hypothetical protein